VGDFTKRGHPRGWPLFVREVNRVWARLRRKSPKPAGCRDGKRPNREDGGDPAPPWVAERIERYAARVAAGLLIFEDRSAEDARAEDLRNRRETSA
jgi:hypothetical protein